MTGRLWRFLRGNESGATAVEFALVALPLFLLVFGTFEFGRLLWTREALQSAAIAGARCVGVKEERCAPGGSYSAGSAVSVIQERARSLYVSVPASGIAINTAAECSERSGFARVTIDYTFESLIAPLLDAIDQLDIQAVACFPNQS